MRSLKSFDFVQALQTPDRLRQSEALAIYLYLGSTSALVRFFTQELPSVLDSLWKMLFQSTTLSLWTGCCLSKSSRQGQGGHAGDSCGTPPGNADSGNHQAASILSPLTGLSQLGNSDIHKTIKVGKVFRHYLPVRAKTCLAFV